MPVSAKNRRLVVRFDDKKLAVHATPKAGFTSVKMACMEALTGNKKKSARSLLVPWEYVPEDFEAVFLVRNPINRAVSAWVNGVASRPRRFSKGLKEAGFYPGMPFSEFVLQLSTGWPDDHHVSPLVDLIRPCSCNSVRIIKLENIDEEWENLRADYGFLPSLPHTNKSDASLARQAKRDRMSISILRELYSDDIRRFGYERPAYK